MFGHTVLDVVAVGSFLGFPPLSDDPALTPVANRRDRQYFKSGPRRMIFQMSAERVDLLMCLRACRLTVDGTRSNAGTVRDTVKQRQQRHRLAESLNVCTGVWCPIVASVLLGSWLVIPLQSIGRGSQSKWRWGDKAKLFVHDRSECCQANVIADEPGSAMVDSMDKQLEFVADCIRNWAGCITQNPGDRLTFQRSFVNQVVGMLHAMVKGLRIPRHGDLHTSRWRGKDGYIFKSSALLKFLLVANLANNNREIANLVKLVTGLVIPDVLKTTLEDLTCKVPSASTISRNMLPLDVAFCQYWKREWETLLGIGPCHDSPVIAPALYGMVDSSPQFQRDWLLIERTGISDCQGLSRECQNMYRSIQEELLVCSFGWSGSRSLEIMGT